MLIVVYLGMYSERFDDTKRGNQNPYIKEKHTMTKIKRTETKNDLHNTTQKTKVRTIRTTLKTGDTLKCSEKVGCSCSTSGTRRFTLATKYVIDHE